MNLEALLAFRLETEDVGATQALTVRLGPHVIGKWLTHTKYEDRSIEVGTRLIAEALAPLIEQSMDEECSRYKGSAYDWERERDDEDF